MKKSILLISALLLVIPMAMAQDFLGYSSGNYIGINGVFSNPANIADSRYRWDVNFIGLNIFAGNNNGSFGIKDLSGDIDSDSIFNRFFPENGKPTDGTGLAVVNGPSFFFNLNRKSAIAFTIQAHALANAFGIESKLIRQLSDVDSNVEFPFTIASSENAIINEHGYTSFGLSYARVIYDQGKHFLKGGISLKYLKGFSNMSINIDNLHATFDEKGQDNNTYINDASGNVALGFGGIDFSDIKANDLFKFKDNGYGMDIGIVYEFRPPGEASSLSLDSISHRRDLNKYKLKVGISVLNIGGIKYSRDRRRSGGYSINIPKDLDFDLSVLKEGSLEDYDSILSNYPNFFTDRDNQESSYRVSTPTTLQLFLDYHLHHRFYVSLATQLSLVSTSDKPFNSRPFNSLVLTPRYESRNFGVYVPISYNSITDLNAGLGLRYAFFFLGSGSILTALTESKQADVYFGVRFGGLYKN